MGHLAIQKVVHHGVSSGVTLPNFWGGGVLKATVLNPTILMDCQTGFSGTTPSSDLWSDSHVHGSSQSLNELLLLLPKLFTFSLFGPLSLLRLLRKNGNLSQNLTFLRK